MIPSRPVPMLVEQLIALPRRDLRPIRRFHLDMRPSSSITRLPVLRWCAAFGAAAR